MYHLKSLFVGFSFHRTNLNNQTPITLINIWRCSKGREPSKFSRSAPKLAAVCFNKAATNSSDFSWNCYRCIVNVNKPKSIRKNPYFINGKIRVEYRWTLNNLWKTSVKEGTLWCEESCEKLEDDVVLVLVLLEGKVVKDGDHGVIHEGGGIPNHGSCKGTNDVVYDPRGSLMLNANI